MTLRPARRSGPAPAPLRRFALGGLAAALLLAAPPAAAQTGDTYYHPPVGSSEVFDRDLIEGPQADRASRESFIAFVTRAQLEAPESPRFAMFAKGADSRRMHIVALDDAFFRTIWRARAVMAQLTYNLRGTPFFQDNGLATVATFYDLLHLLGFESLILSDGAEWAHRVEFRRPAE